MIRTIKKKLNNEKNKKILIKAKKNHKLSKVKKK